MIVSHKHKFIFIKTYKTASTSLEIALSQFVGERGVITTIDQWDEAIRAELGFRGPQNLEIPLHRYTLRNWAERLRRGKQALGVYVLQRLLQALTYRVDRLHLAARDGDHSENNPRFR